MNARSRLGYKISKEFAETQQKGGEMQEQFSQNFAKLVAWFLGQLQEVRKSLTTWTNNRGPLILPEQSPQCRINFFVADQHLAAHGSLAGASDSERPRGAL